VPQRKRDVAERGEGVKKGPALKQHAESFSKLAQLLVRHAAEVVLVYVDVARVGLE
jgi:hypothetical protein